MAQFSHNHPDEKFFDLLFVHVYFLITHVYYVILCGLLSSDRTTHV